MYCILCTGIHTVLNDKVCQIYDDMFIVLYCILVLGHLVILHFMMEWDRKSYYFMNPLKEKSTKVASFECYTLVCGTKHESN